MKAQFLFVALLYIILLTSAILVTSCQDEEAPSKVREMTDASFPEDSPAGFLDHVTLAELNGTLYAFGHNVIWNIDSHIEVWSSTDGKSWKMETSDIGTNKRRDYAVTSFKGKLWIIGGDEATAHKNDVWSSENGADWEQVTDEAEFDPRAKHKSVVLRDSIYVIGGTNEEQEKLGDIWRSSNGKDWELVTEGIGFLEERYGFKVTTFQDQIWIGSGRSNNNFLSDYYLSSDGLSWNPSVDLEKIIDEDRMVSTQEAIWITGIIGNDFQLRRVTPGNVVLEDQQVAKLSELLKLRGKDGWPLHPDNGYYDIIPFQGKLLIMFNFIDEELEAVRPKVFIYNLPI